MTEITTQEEWSVAWKLAKKRLASLEAEHPGIPDMEFFHELLVSPFFSSVFLRWVDDLDNFNVVGLPVEFAFFLSENPLFPMMMEGDEREMFETFFAYMEDRLLFVHLMYWHNTMPVRAFINALDDATVEAVSHASHDVEFYKPTFGISNMDDVISTFVNASVVDFSLRYSKLIEPLKLQSYGYRRFLCTMARSLSMPCPKTPMAVLDVDE